MCIELRLCSLLLSLFVIIQGVFIEMPTSQTVSVGEVAEFRCRHPTADTIRWRVNGTLVSVNRPPPDITLRVDSELVYILTIIGLPEYNGTEVVGVARFDDDSPDETTNPEAMLIVLMNITDNGISQTGFIEEPLSLNVTIREEAVFHCEHRSADAIFWRINGTALSSRPGLHDDFIVENIGRFHTLTVTARPEYNTTVVQCVAFFDSGNSQPERTAPAVLQIQGILNRINALVRNFTTLFWMPPYSLNLTNVEPDIVYCVDVYNITCGGRELLTCDCDVTETSYTSDAIAPDGYIYEYIVTPRSNVEGAVNGTPSQPLRDQFTPLSLRSSQLSVINTTTVTYEVLFTLNIIEHNLSIPSSFTLSLDSLDGLGDMDSVNTVTTRFGAVLTLDVPTMLPRHRLWNLIITPYRCQNGRLSVLGDAELSTHDVQNISVSSPQPCEVRVTGDFIDGSTATGLLIIIYSANITEYQLVQGRVNLEAVISGLLEGEYQVSVFVVNENGVPFSRAASTPKQVATSSAVVNAENKLMKYPIEYILVPNSTGVTVVCEFLDTNSITSTKSCIVVVHQHVNQLNSSGLLNIDSYIFTRDGDTASGFIEGLNLKEYQIGVIGGIRRVPSESNAGLPSCSRASLVCVGSITASVVAGFLLIAIVVITCTILGKRSRTHNENTGEESSVAGVQMKRCEAYEVTTLARKKITMEPNLAYEPVCIV